MKTPRVAFFYDHLAPGFDDLVAEDSAEVETIEALLPAVPGRALDVGAGSGRFALPALRRGWRVDAVDFSARMLEIAASKAAAEGYSAQLRCRLTDLRRPSSLPHGPYDLSLCIGFLFHLPISVRPRLLRALASRLASGAVLLIDAETGPRGGWGEGRSVETAGPLTLVIDSRAHPRRLAQRGRLVIHGSSNPVSVTAQSTWVNPDTLAKEIEQAGFSITDILLGWGSAGCRPSPQNVLVRAVRANRD